MPLTGKQKRYLRGLANPIKKAQVCIGAPGLSDNVIKETSVALKRFELIKVKMTNTGSMEQTKKEVGAMLAGLTKSDLVQVLGHNLILFRPNPDTGKIKLP